MALLEIFLRSGCPSEAAARALSGELRSICPDLTIQIRSLLQAKDRADALGIIVAPAFVLNGKLIAVGVHEKHG